MTFAHQGRFYLGWPLAAAGVFVWFYSSKRKIAFKQFCQPGATFPRKGDAVARQVCTCFSRSSDSCRHRISIFAPLLYQFHMAAGWHDARLSVPDVLFHIAIANELTHTLSSASTNSLPVTRSRIITEWILRLRCSRGQPV